MGNGNAGKGMTANENLEPIPRHLHHQDQWAILSAHSILPTLTKITKKPVEIATTTLELLLNNDWDSHRSRWKTDRQTDDRRKCT